MFKLLEEIRAIAQLGLNYSTDVYDRERYGRLLSIASSEYASLSDLSPEVISDPKGRRSLIAFGLNWVTLLLKWGFRRLFLIPKLKFC